jgi:hypothetical protein
LIQFDIHAFESASRRVILILAAHLSFVLSGIEAQTSRLQPVTHPDLVKDEQQLLNLHAQERDAHLKGDADLLASEIASEFVSVRDGEVESDSREEVRHQFAERFRRVRYSEWDDVIPPRVQISPDGKMVSVVVQIRARYRDWTGLSLGEEHKFLSSWVATYEKQQSEWHMVAIASGVKEIVKQISSLQPLSVTPTSAEIFAAAEAAMGTEDARASIRSISSIAACHGPKGDYETRVISDRNGNLSFQQFLSDHKNIEGILDGRGWELDDRGRSESIDDIEVSVLRGHEFPMMALDLRRRFHDFKSLGRAQFEGQATTQIAMTDDLGHSVSAYFSLTSHLPVGLISTNPRTGRPATIRFDAWRSVSGVNLVSHVTILYDAETWVFDFQALNLNTTNNKTFQIPGTTGSSEPQ